MSSKKIITTSILLAVLAEVFLVYIIYFNQNKISPIMDPSIQPWFNALFNALSALCLLAAFIFIKRKQVKAHIVSIHFALGFSAIFLVSYIFYHMSVGHVRFENPEWRTFYLLILISHLSLSFITLPMIFCSYGLGIFKKLSEHKKLAKITFWFWEYVSITGVLIVWMLKNLN